ncbi:MAG: hypothetical protein AAF368_08915 [Planctomycetota bacterium]
MKWFLLILLVALGGGLIALLQRGEDRDRPTLIELPSGQAPDRPSSREPASYDLVSPASAGGEARAELKPRWKEELDDFIALQDEQFFGLPEGVHDPYQLSEAMVLAAEENYSSQWLFDENGERVRHGPWESNYPSGHVEELGAYDQGQEQGLWQWLSSRQLKSSCPTMFR